MILADGHKDQAQSEYKFCFKNVQESGTFLGQALIQGNLAVWEGRVLCKDFCWSLETKAYGY